MGKQIIAFVAGAFIVAAFAFVTPKKDTPELIQVSETIFKVDGITYVKQPDGTFCPCVPGGCPNYPLCGGPSN